MRWRRECGADWQRSTKFSLECVDSSRGVKYKQTWSDNMKFKSPAVVNDCGSATDYVQVEFW